MFNIILLIANILAFFSTALQINSVYHNRNLIRGYSIFGSLITIVVMCLFAYYYLTIEEYWNIFFTLFTASYWSIAFIFSLRKWYKDYNLLKIINKRKI